MSDDAGVRARLREEIRRTWKWGIPLVVLLTVVGLLAGLAIDKAVGATVTPVQMSTAVMMVDSCGESCSSSVVKRKRQGVRKFRDGKVDRQPKGIKYTRAHKRKIKRALYKAYQRQVSNGNAKAVALSPESGTKSDVKAYLWDRFKTVDRCGYRAYKDTGTWATWTCDTPAPKIRNQLSGEEIRGIVCWSAAGLAVPSVVLTGGTAATFWGLVGIGAGASACTWGPMLEKAGN